MAQREMYSSLNPGKVSALYPQLVQSTDVESAAIDLATYNSALIIYHFGISGDTLSGSVYSTGTLTECDTSNGSFTAVAAADIKGTLPVIDDAGEDPSIHVVAYLGKKRFIKVGVATTGTHTVGTYDSITVLRGHVSRQGE